MCVLFYFNQILDSNIVMWVRQGMVLVLLCPEHTVSLKLKTKITNKTNKINSISFQYKKKNTGLHLKVIIRSYI